MKFYAYVPDENGNEPVGTKIATSRHIFFNKKSIRSAISHARTVLGNDIKIFTYINWFDKCEKRKRVY